MPYYFRLEELHRHARTLPRKSNWARLAEVIDRLVVQAIETDRPAAEILEQAQAEIRRRELGA